MFDVEKLLGKMMSEVTNSSKNYKKKGKKKYKKKHRSDDVVSKLASGLLSGKGLLTAVGLGVGAYTILKGSNSSATPLPQSANTTAAGYQTPPATPAQPPPVPPVPQTSTEAQRNTHEEVATSNAVNASALQQQELENKDIALRLIQVMIAAAHADGQIDQDEEKEILSYLQGAGLTKEEKDFILLEFHAPKTIEELVQGINDPKLSQAMYSLAVSTIIVDTKEERAWLDNFGNALNISSDMQQFIEG